MSLTRVLAIIVGLVVLGAGAWFGRALLTQDRPRPVPVAAPRAPEAPKPAALQVMVARRDIPTGQIIKPDDLRWQAWPEGTLSEAYIIEGRRPMSDFVGAVARQGITAGEPVTEPRVVLPGSRSFMAAVLRPGFRAVSVGVTPTSGISGFVFAGDQVDLLMTHKISRGEDRNYLVTETVLRNIRVLAVDQKVDAKPGDAPLVARTATLEVTPKQAEIVAIIGEMGRLSLSLRSLQDSSDPDRDAEAPKVTEDEDLEVGRDLRLMSGSYTRDDQVSRFVAPYAARARTISVTIYRGGAGGGAK